ncbi:MAG: response regulator [Nannocystales bacterium]
MDTADELKKLRAQLAEREREVTVLRAAIRASPAGILIASSPGGELEEWNPAALGIRTSEDSDALTELPAELDPAGWNAFRPNGDPYAPEELPLPRALQREEVVEGEDFVLRDGAGNERWLSGHAAPVYADGELVGAVAVLPDVTKRRNAELDARRFRRMAELSPAFVGLWRLDGPVTYVNPAGLELSGLTEETSEGRSLPDFLTDASADRLTEVGLPTARDQGHWQSEVELRSATQTPVPVSLALVVHEPDDDGQRYVSAVMTDLRPMQELESQLRQSQKLESIGRLAGGVAHDLNNLLTIIDNYTAAVHKTLSATDRRHEDLTEVLVASGRAAELCTQLLSFARRQIIQPTVLQLSTAVDELMRLLHRMLGPGVVPRVEVADDLWPIEVDRSQLDQILLNLVANARDSMPDGGQLSIAARNVQLAATFSTTHSEIEPGDYVVLAVTDTGAGMSKLSRDRAFEPFFTTKMHAGTGLGLATVFGAVRQNHGHIDLKSEEGTGTSFEIYWPRAKAQPTPEVPVEAAPSAGGTTVLVAEDEPVLLRLTVRGLQRSGYEVLAAGSGAEALELSSAYDGTIDLLLTDVAMPHMNGRELAAKLHEDRPDVCVLYVSGYPEDALLENGVLAKNVAYLPKPFSIDGLLEAVSALLASG